MSRTDEVVEAIKAMILDGRLQAGARLPVEKDLADELGVSRGPLREGVRALVTLGILETRQGDGTYVTSLDPSRLLSSMGFFVDLHADGSAQPFHAVRRLLETESAGLAATRITPEALARAREVLDEVREILGRTPVDHEAFIATDIEFHRIVAENSGNPVLAAFVESLASRTARTRLWRGLHEEGAEERTWHEHDAIWRALEAGNAEAARIRMASHLLGVEEAMQLLPLDEE
ncbi:FadR/GntR family transcriptional regulator [Cellulomonas sp. URHD0024]|uniref:FadR/GntR family transcriptional regulator n=1 Tax=Cellulomonas sp. URHD0024 TaxID=1302620 RepID=UPI0003FD3CFD|nr:FadR/GntR family transcriptional regulator [Cellulomonas sp. URHD0024]